MESNYKNTKGGYILKLYFRFDISDFTSLKHTYSAKDTEYLKCII
jgi:hypothetical protein